MRKGNMQNPALHNPQLEGGPFFWEAGPVGVLLSHGYTATTAEVRLLAKRLHEKGYTVAGPLLAGHGTQSADLNHVSWRDWVASAEKTYEQLITRCKRIFIGGQSMGGVVALQLASQHPEAAGLLLYAPAIKLTMTTLDKIKLYAGSLFMSEVARESWMDPTSGRATRAYRSKVRFNYCKCKAQCDNACR
ncbi:MAG: alpha/beta fold hydrolase [Anaerolineales bacterium]|uniref:alpha/beta hydrolase n=1 Tax=Candidatus Villigracilis proximus TaxID=3140683 RepID=UPI003136CF80|nr:alpha/beta fold hydrolase [Anaerolineales bacterium]